MDYAPIISSGLGQHDSVMAGMSPSDHAPVARTSSATDLPVKYPPVTGRISRATKGVPVYTCEICIRTYTRAEHLRRHQLSHQKPKFPRTFKDCERGFHRSDLLARHLNRHETQGERAYKLGESRSRASSAEPELGEGRSLKSCGRPRSESMTYSSFSAITSNFQAVSLPESECDGTTSSSGASSSISKDNFKQMTFPAKVVSGNLGNFSPPSQPGFGDIYIESADAFLPLPLLRIPEEHYIPGLSYTQENSPWCSSSSDSTYSTQSDGPRWKRHRSSSIATVPDWNSPFELQPSPYIAKNEPHGSSCPSMEPILIQEDVFHLPYYISAINFDLQYMQGQFTSVFDPVPFDRALEIETEALGLLGAKRQELLDLQQLAQQRLARSRASRAQAYSDSPQRIEVPNSIGVQDIKHSQPENILHCDPETISEASAITTRGNKIRKVQNLVSDSVAFSCFVASCPSPNPRFLSRKAQIGHYELYHSALLLRCEFEVCNGHAGAFIEESDRENHYKSHHLRDPIERPERARAPRPGYESKESNSENETSCTDGSVGQQKGQNIFQECEMKEVLKIKIEESSDSERSKILGVLPCNPPPTTEGKSIDHPSPASSRSTCRDPSAGFETDSTCSDGDSDYGKDNISWDDPDVIAMVCKRLQVSSAERSGRIIDPIISPLKESLVERIMGDFWSLFNHEWSENIRKQTGSPSTPSSSVSDPKSKSSAEKSNKNHKRIYDDNRDRRQDEDENEGPKPPRCTSPSSEVDEDSQQKFSCPYRKHNPRKYTHCDRVWRTCALAPFSTVARVKGHLYRNHRIFQCRRCNGLFKDDDALQNHFMAVKPCSLQEPAPAEGITAILEKKLRSRKRASSSQSQEERWQEIYRSLFPMEIVPSAFFEPVQDELIHSPGSFELANYEEFSRQELPRVFRGALEAVINTAAQPLEEQLRGQLVSMIQECQDRVFSSYRTRNSSGPVASTTTQPPSFSAPILTSSIIPDAVNLSSLLEERPIEFLDNLYQHPPYQSQFLSNSEFQLRGGQQASETTTGNEHSEFDYVSDFSVMHASSSMSQGTRTDLTSELASNLSGNKPRSHLTEDRGDTENDNTQSFTAFADDSTTEAQSISLQQEVDGTFFPPEDFPDLYLYNSQSWDTPFSGND